MATSSLNGMEVEEWERWQAGALILLSILVVVVVVGGL